MRETEEDQGVSPVRSLNPGSLTLRQDFDSLGDETNLNDGF